MFVPDASASMRPKSSAISASVRNSPQLRSISETSACPSPDTAAGTAAAAAGFAASSSASVSGAAAVPSTAAAGSATCKPTCSVGREQCSTELPKRVIAFTSEITSVRPSLILVTPSAPFSPQCALPQQHKG